MKVYNAILTIAILLSSALAVSVVTAPPPPTTVYVDPDPAVAMVPGESLLVFIMIEGVPLETPIYSMGIMMEWHGPLLHVPNGQPGVPDEYGYERVGVDEGDFLMRGGTTFMTVSVDNTDIHSYVQIGLTLIGATGGVSGDGILVIIEFLVEGTGECVLDVTTTLLSPNPTPPPTFLEVAHTDEDGEFYTTETYWKARLVQRSAWPEKHHFDISANAPDPNNTLFAKVRNLGSMDVATQVLFRIRRDDGMVVFLETSPYVLTTVEETHIFSMEFNTTKYGAGKFYVETKVKYDINGDGVIDTWSPKVKSFSFAVVP